MTTAVTRLSLDAAAPPLAQDIGGTVVNDQVQVLVDVTDFQAGDVVVEAAFTAKVAKTDADSAPTTVQVIVSTATALDDSTYRFTFPLTQAQSISLETTHGYDVRVWVTRGGLTYARTVQQGTFLSYLGWTSRSSPSSPLATEDARLLVTEG
jgi:homoserine acetyltransferase